jgi:hypothetical protein
VTGTATGPKRIGRRALVAPRVLSAMSAFALADQAARSQRFVEQPIDADANDVAYSLVACRLGFARRPSQLPHDDSCDDNRDDSGTLNYVPHNPKMQVSCLVTAPACCWQCGGPGFESP